MSDHKGSKEEKLPGSTEQWDVARRYTNLYGAVPSSFSSLIRALIADHHKGAELSFGACWQMKRLLRSDSMKAPYYFALKTFHKDFFARGRSFTIDDFSRAMKPLDLAAVLGVLYLYRRARHLCEEGEWKFVGPPLQTRCEVGGLIGMVMENVGLALGLLAGAMRTLAMTAYYFHDRSGFTDYRRQLKISKENFDLEKEIKRWGCSHIHIASGLLVALGLGTDVAQVVCKGFEMNELNIDLAKSKAYAVRVTEAWCDALIAGGSPPEMVHSGLYYPLKEDLQRLKDEAARTVRAGSQFMWLDRGKDSVNPQEMPELCAQGAAAEEEPPQAGVPEDLSGDILEE